MSYCQYCRKLPPDNIHRRYHDAIYGVEITDDAELFGRLLLEMNQAGLSWDTILKREAHFRRAYDGFQLEIVANYQSTDIERLLADPGIIRNRLKIHAAIHNARQILTLIETHGSFYQWIQQQEAKNTSEWVKLFKKNFKFVGTEIVKEFLFSIGRIPGAHDLDCPSYRH
ncbi:MAG: DNA-3-methyladenine glycosylase I [Flavobacteriales bacterium]